MIPELRGSTKQGEPYERPEKIRAALDDLYALPIEEVAKRAQSIPEGEEGFVPSECVLHFVRQSKVNGDAAPYMALFKELRTRAANLVPAKCRRTGTDQYLPISSFNAEVQEKVLDALLELVCQDREEYSQRLDFFEVRFNMAVTRLRSTARKKLARRREHEQEAAYKGNSTAFSADLENLLASVRNSPDPEKNFFRFEVRQAIDQLPSDERHVIELLHMKDLPIEAKDPATLSVSKLLKCTDRTVRNRRDRAYKQLKEILGDDWSEL